MENYCICKCSLSNVSKKISYTKIIPFFFLLCSFLSSIFFYPVANQSTLRIVLTPSLTLLANPIKERLVILFAIDSETLRIRIVCGIDCFLDRKGVEHLWQPPVQRNE